MIMLCRPKNKENTSCTEVTKSSLEKFVIDFQHQVFEKNQDFRNQKFDYFDLVRLKYSSIGFDLLCRGI